MAFGNNAFTQTLDAASLQTVLEEAAIHNPRLMLHTRDNIHTIRDAPHFKNLLTALLEEED